MINITPSDFEKQFPSETHEKKVFNFTKEELATVRTYNTIKTLGEMAALFIDKMLNGMCLPKVGIEPKNGVGTIYDSNAGTYTVYVPRYYCELCKQEPGQFDLNEQKYCKNCFPLVKLKQEMDEQKTTNIQDVPADTVGKGDTETN